MAGRRLMIGQGGQRVFRPVVRVLEVDVIISRARAIEGRDVVIAVGRAVLDELGNAHDLDLGLGQGRERLPSPGIQLLHLLVMASKDPGGALDNLCIMLLRVLCSWIDPVDPGTAYK